MPVRQAPPMVVSRSFAADIIASGTAAAILGGIPSTVYALVMGADPLEATRAAGAMLVDPASADAMLIAAAAVAHLGVNFFWAILLAWLLPRRHVLAWALLAAVAIALIDLRVIAPLFFPEVHALAFGPQLADHLAWGAALGGVLAWRWRCRGGQPAA